MKTKKPTVKLIGTDGNVFALIGKTQEALKKAGLVKEAKEFVKRAFRAGSYDNVLVLIQKYCEVT